MKRGVKPTVIPEDWIRAIVAEMKRTDGVEFSIATVAGRIGVTKGSFYNYFASKDDAVRQAIDAWRAEEDAVLEQYARNPPRTLEELIRSNFEAIGSWSYPLGLFLSGLPRRHTKLRRLAVTMQAERYQQFEPALRACGVPPQVSSTIAIAMLSVLVGLSYLEQFRWLTKVDTGMTRAERWETTTNEMCRAFLAIAERGSRT